MTDKPPTKRVTLRDLTNEGATVLDELAATQSVAVIHRRTTDIAVIVPVARYSAMLRKIRQTEGEK